MKQLHSKLNNQKGAILLTVLVIWAVGAPVIYTMGRYMEHRRADIENVHNKLEKDEDITEEEFDRAHSAVPDVARVAQAGGSMLNSISNIGVPDAGTAISTIADAGIGEMVSQGSNPAATSSNPVPSDVRPPSTCSGSNLSNCTNSGSCANAGGYWHSNNTCNAAPEPACRRTNLAGCGDSADCTSAGGHWYDETCNAEEQPECRADNLGGCSGSDECAAASGHWYDNQCNSDPQPACDNDNLDLCTDSAACGNAGGHWYDNQCNRSPEACYSSNVTLCATESDCANANGHWYDGGCHAEEQDSCASRGGTFTCANGTQICADLACNNTDNCGDNSDENNCGDQSSCCVMTNGCPGETATSCADTCCCCPYGQICDQSNPANGCISAW